MSSGIINTVYVYLEAAYLKGYSTTDIYHLSLGVTPGVSPLFFLTAVKVVRNCLNRAAVEHAGHYSIQRL